MTKFTNSTESKTETTNTGYSEEATSTIPTPGLTTTEVDSNTDDGKDEFGYDIEPEKVVPAEEVKSEKPEDIKIEKKSTGYDTEEKDEPETEEVAETEEVKDEKKEISEVLKELPEGYSSEKILDFALKNKMNKDQVKAYVEMQKAAATESVAQQEKMKVEQRSNFINELKTDSEFGGENFDRNIMRSERVLEKHFPNMKKVLTERGGIVPPYIMKDFLRLDKMLNPTESLVNGDPVIPATNDENNFLDDLYN